MTWLQINFGPFFTAYIFIYSVFKMHNQRRDAVIVSLTCKLQTCMQAVESAANWRVNILTVGMRRHPGLGWDRHRLSPFTQVVMVSIGQVSTPRRRWMEQDGPTAPAAQCDVFIQPVICRILKAVAAAAGGDAGVRRWSIIHRIRAAAPLYRA